MFNKYFKTILINEKKICFISGLLLFAGCKEVYRPATNSPETGYLVVEGFISSGDDTTFVTLSRTVKTEDTVTLNYERNATIAVEGENNEDYPLTESVNGVYASNGALHLNNAEKYRLYIRTSTGKEYASDFSAVKHTPPIDSITWKVDNGGIGIYANTHDTNTDTGFYRWTYSETWEFHSPFLHTAYYQVDPVTNQVYGIVAGDPDTTIYKCWKTQNSKNIIIGSTQKLSENRIYLPVRYIEPQADELSILYYIELKQYSLSHNAYFFYENLKKNTEQIGTIFDPQPSELSTNIHCISNPSEMVIGYVEVSQEQVKKLFIHHDELPLLWAIHIPCGEQLMVFKPGLTFPSEIPTYISQPGGFGAEIKYYAADPICVDCTKRGTNVKPSFWP